MPDEHRQAEKMRKDVPSTIARSDDKAVRTYKKTLESAEDSYGSGERAHRAAFSALKHTHEKVGDHWEPKDEPGPSDAQAAQKGSDALDRPKETAEGVDTRATKAHLLDLAKKLGVSGRSRMDKEELVEAIRKANARATRKARS
jgi:cation transport regulator ChaB